MVYRNMTKRSKTSDITHGAARLKILDKWSQFRLGTHLLELSVAPLMIQHVALRAEPFVAVGAPERTFVAMYALMDSQVLLLREAFTAAWELTAVRLCPVVDMLVRLQADLPPECLAAALKKTCENLFKFSLYLLLQVVFAEIGVLRIIIAVINRLMFVLSSFAGADQLTLF